MKLIPVLAGVLALAALAAAPARAIEPRRVVSDGGVEAWLVEDHANPVISVKLAFRGGSALDPKGKPGVANLVAGTLTKGAGELKSRAFQRKLAEKAIKLSFDVGRDSFRGSLKTLTDNRQRAFRLLGLALTRPRFDPQPVARVKSQVRASLATRQEEPAHIANRTLYRAIFPDHPYGRPVEGTRASVKTMKPADLRRYVETAFTRDRLVIGVAGDITPKELKPLLDKAFGDLPEHADGGRTVPDTTLKAAGETIVVERDIRQAWVALAQPGVTRDDPDYFAARVVNYILGGGSFASRLMKEVREKRGLVYSVYTYLSTLRHGPVLGGGLGTGNARVAEALAVVRDTWRRLAAEGPTKQEVADAKTYLKGSFPLNLQSTGGIASVLRAMQLNELGIDYLERRDKLIEAVSPADAKRVAGELLRPGGLTTVIVGKPKGVKATMPAPETGS